MITRSSSKLLLKHLLVNPMEISSVKQLASNMDLLSFSSDQADNTSSSLDDICRQVIKALPSEAAAVRAGHRNVINKLVGRVMKETKGRAGAQTAREVIERLLS
jgi:aspartyl-tRNA(Asn)/glutamyl-tRNA(Gln) amidotransferase subunit B